VNLEEKVDTIVITRHTHKNYRGHMRWYTTEESVWKWSQTREPGMAHRISWAESHVDKNV